MAEPSPDVMTLRVVRARSEGAAETLAPAPARNFGFRELEAVRFRTDVPGRWTLDLDDQPLEAQTRDEVTEWMWVPGFFAGPVVAELLNSQDGRVLTYLFEVEPDPGKLSATTFDEMVATLRKESPGLLLGDEPATTAFGALGDHDDPWFAFARLRRHGNDFVKGLRAISTEPIRVLRSTRRTVGANMVRRVDPASLRSILRQPDLAASLTGRERPVGTAMAGDSRGIDVPHTEDSLDGAANRCMAALVDASIRRVRSVRERLDDIVGRESGGDTVTAVTPRWPRRRAFLDSLEKALTSQRRASPLRDVTRPEITAAGLTAVAAHPLYQRCYRLGWKSLRVGMGGPAEDDRNWMGPSWQIFERWCFVRLAAELRQSLPEMTWVRWERSGNALAAWSGTDGERRLDLLLQPMFPGGADRRSGRFSSISTGRVPDIVLMETSPTSRRFVVLDAKYRASRGNVLDAMDSAHIYHDALRFDGAAPDVVILLIPAGGGAPWLESPEFLARNGIGVWATGGWDGAEIIRRVLGSSAMG